MSTETMSRKRMRKIETKQQIIDDPFSGLSDNRTVVNDLVQEPDAVPKPRVTSFVARDCTACTALRDLDESAKGKSFARVYATVGRTRYCKCGYCGNTWKQIDE